MLPIFPEETSIGVRGQARKTREQQAEDRKRKRPTLNANVEGRQCAAGSSPLEIAVCNSRKIVVAVPDASDSTSDDGLRHSAAKREGRGGRL